jgi:hypothetical protein
MLAEASTKGILAAVNSKEIEEMEKGDFKKKQEK